jgi:PPK2 family polyphosphate:nucleotide phosphotransferase
VDSYAERVEPGQKVHLAAIKTDHTRGVSRADGEKLLESLGTDLTELQELHFASGHGGVLIVLQGLDTAGKDGTIRHVLAHFNPAACRVESFRAPTPDEREHDFLWRVHRVTPPSGAITIFNRSHYEDVLVTRVHELVPQDVWASRYEQINHFEALLSDCGTTILKFFLYISKDEQSERLKARENDPSKAWKLSTSDWPEHRLYEKYVAAYEDALMRCSTKHAPWYIVPADHKWFRNLAVAQTIVETLKPWKHKWERELEDRGKQQLAAVAVAAAAANK